MRVFDFAVPRASHEEITYAKVSIETSRWKTKAEVFAAIIAAVTEWANTTETGREAAADLAGMFNIGDLACEDFTSGSQLGEIFRRHGIDTIDIEIESHEPDDLEWEYDSTLMDPTKLIETVECGLCEKLTPAASAHMHHGRQIGECCWDERLRASE